MAGCFRPYRAAVRVSCQPKVPRRGRVKSCAAYGVGSSSDTPALKGLTFASER